MPLLNVEDRSPEVQAAATKFEMTDLVSPDARQMASSFARLAQEIIFRLRGDDREDLLAETLDALHVARTHAISAVLPAVRRPQFEAHEAAKSVPEVSEDLEEQSTQDPPAPTVRETTARSKTARTRAAASR